MPLTLSLVVFLLYINCAESSYRRRAQYDHQPPKHNYPSFRKPEVSEESLQLLEGSNEDYPLQEEEEGDPGNPNCPGCAETVLTPEEIRRLRIEKIKEKILHKLRLKARPNITISREDLPAPLSHGDISSNPSDYSKEPRVKYDYYGRTEHVIIFPDENSYPCFPTRHHPAKCLHFPQAASFTDADVASAELWVYKLPDERDYRNQTFIVNDLISIRTSSIKKRVHTSMIETSLTSGWMKFDVKSALSRWVGRSTTERWLEVVCRSCQMNSTFSPISMASGQRPFLVLSMDNNHEKQRGKRSVTCESGTTQCCRESLFISFREIGWDDWIIQPQGYTANYCRGSCMEDVTIPMSGSHHTTVMQRYVQNKNLTPDQKITLTPCCTPTHMSEISLLYVADETGQIVHKKLPDMVVEACGCS